jgi:hypothetical protein
VTKQGNKEKKGRMKKRGKVDEIERERERYWTSYLYYLTFLF